MEFDREYFLDEVRDGFFIPSMMKRQWAICIDDYRRLVEVCQKHGLVSSATWGTLIGAVRHGGFIPWDDDVDMDMLREDFEKLVEIVGKEEKDGQYHIDDFTTAKNTNMVRRWMEKTVMIYEPERWGERYGFPFGNAIDIFVLDNIPVKNEKYKEYLRVIYLCETLRTDYIKVGDDKETPEMLDKIKELEEIVGYSVDVERDGHEGVQLFEVLDDYLRRVTVESATNRKEDYRRACASEYIRNQNYIAPKSDTYDGFIEISFENTTIPVPYGYDGLLRKLFWNYTTPIRVFGGHMYPSYDSLRNPLRDKYDFELLTYHFDHDKYRQVIDSRQKRIPLADSVKAQVELLKEAHGYIRKVMGESDENSYAEVLDILGQCQELAVNMGEMIESRAKNPDQAVRILEQYCETVFSLYDGMGKGEDVSEYVNSIDVYEKEFLGDGFCVIEEMKEVVFLVDRAKNWDSLHTIWEAAIQDEDTRVTVIAIPYAYKDEYGMIPENKWETDENKLPTEIELTPYDQYDFSRRHPDVVIYQNPYDAYSDGISVHPFYYAENLCKYVDRMVFIPPFTLAEIVPEDFRGRYTLGVFVRNPGLVYADRIIVQSESMSEVYAELLSDMTDDIDWKSKIIGVGSAKNDYDSHLRIEEFHNRRELSDAPRILFYLSASMLYDNGMTALEKKIETFEYLREHEYEGDKVIVDLYRDPYAEEILKNSRPEVYKAYDEWLQRVGTSVISEKKKQPDPRIASGYDAFYGDGGVMLYRFQMQGKPSLWENPEATYEGEEFERFFEELRIAMEVPENTGDGKKIYRAIDSIF